jgi:hypothetical protein
MEKRSYVLTKEGEAFIMKACSGTNSLLQGTNGVMVFSYPETNKTWIAQPKDDGGKLITTNAELGKQLIKWYNKYAIIFELDANILAAQAFQESKYALWAYPKKRDNPKYDSSATSITQFLIRTLFSVVVKNVFASKEEYRFTENEISAIFVKNCSGNTNVYETFKVGGVNKIGRYNRPIVHQNAMDNPEIMIKAQFVYMKHISKLAKNIASTTLYGYNRGEGFIRKESPSYTQTINYSAYREGDDYPKEGIDYVFRIFNYLGNPESAKYTIDGTKFTNCFGYNKPPFNIDCNIANFNKYQAETDESNLLY